MNAPRRLTDRVAVVTGSTRGIGAAIARRLHAAGAHVVVTGRTSEDGRAVVESVPEGQDRITFVRADMREPDEISALFEATTERFGTPTLLVNNAAVQTPTAVGEATHEEWDLVVETNFRSYWLCAKEFTQRADSGSIINVSSNHAKLTMPAHFPYNAVKAGIDGMTRAMALDWGPDIRVNAVNPGWIAVERTVGEMSPERRRDLASIHPVGRIGEPDDVARLVAFLAREESGFITGETVLVDGGRTAVMQDDTLPDYRARREE